MFSGTPLYLTAIAGVGAGSWAIKDVAPGANTATSANFGTDTNIRYLQARPNTQTSGVGTSLPTNTATGVGWNIIPADMDPAAGDRRVIPAGTWVFAVTFGPGTADTAAQFTIRLHLYKKSGSTYTIIGDPVTGSLVSATVGAQAFTLNLVVATDQYFAVGETLHAEFWIRGKGGGATGLLNQTITFNLGGTTTSRITLPSQGMRTEFVRAGSDVARGSDSAVRFVAFPRAVPDVAKAVDSLVRATVTSRPTSDVAKASDTTARATAVGRAIPDTAPASDSMARSVIVARALSDVAKAVDTVARATIQARPTSDVARASDAVTRVAHFPRATNDVAGASDVVTRLALFIRAASDVARASDVVDRAVIIARALSDVARASDTVGRAVILARAMTDTALASDSLVRVANFIRAIPDVARASDTLQRQAIFNRQITDVARASDVLARDLNYVRQIRDFIGGPADFPVDFPTGEITGVVRDSNGTPYVGATVKLFRMEDDVIIATTTSAADGSYQFLRDRFDPYHYFVVAYEETGEATQGMTVRGLTPENV